MGECGLSQSRRQMQRLEIFRFLLLLPPRESPLFGGLSIFALPVYRARVGELITLPTHCQEEVHCILPPVASDSVPDCFPWASTQTPSRRPVLPVPYTYCLPRTLKVRPRLVAVQVGECGLSRAAARSSALPSREP